MTPELLSAPRMSADRTELDASQSARFARAQTQHLLVLLKIFHPRVTFIYLLFLILVFPAKASNSRAKALPPVALLETTRTVSSPAIVPMISLIPE